MMNFNFYNPTNLFFGVGAFCILLEFVQLLAVFILLYEFFLPITIMGWVFHFGVLLYLINRDEIPEFKLPWLIILFLLPVLGAFIFMLLSSNSTSKKEYERSEKALSEIRRFYAALYDGSHDDAVRFKRDERYHVPCRRNIVQRRAGSGQQYCIEQNRSGVN